MLFLDINRRVLTNRLAGSLLLTGLLLLPYLAHARSPRVGQTRETKATPNSPFGAPSPWNANVLLNREQPWIPFDTTRSPVRGRYELIPAAVNLLQERAVTPKNYVEQQRNDHDTVLAASTLAAIGGRRTVNEALPAMLRAIAARGGKDANFVTGWEIMNCMVTLCGPRNVARNIVAVMKTHPAPRVRAAAATALGMSAQLLGNYHVEKGPDGRYRLLRGQAALRSDLWDAIPGMAKAAATDGSPMVRLAALDALHNGIYGTSSADWKAAFPYIAQILKAPVSTTAERRAALRVLAEAPANPLPVAAAFRPYLSARDDQSRGYALVALGNIVKSGSGAAVTKWYLSEMASDNKRLQALRELETAAGVVYGQSLWIQGIPAGINYSTDTRLMHGGSRPAASAAVTNTLSRQLLTALVKHGLTDRRPEARLSTAVVVEKIGKTASSRRRQRRAGDGDDGPAVKQALLMAGKAVRGDNPALSLRLFQQGNPGERSMEF